MYDIISLKGVQGKKKKGAAPNNWRIMFRLETVRLEQKELYINPVS